MGTPMIEQYKQIKRENPDSILFFRLGDFYEMFYDDAILVSKELELTLTGKDCGEEQRAPMCGIPYHAVDSYLGRLVARGYKIAICEQTEDPSQKANIVVQRDVVRIVTPGTVFESELLPETKNNYICSIFIDGTRAGITFADISTGDVYTTYISGDDRDGRILNEIAKYSPREFIVNFQKNECGFIAEYCERNRAFITYAQSDRYEPSYAKKVLTNVFGYVSDECQIESVCASGALMDYLCETQKADITDLKPLNIYTSGTYLEIDANTRRNLELTENMRMREKRGSLLWVIDKTKTAFGGRMIRKWVEEPLVNMRSIIKRQNALRELYDDFMLREELSDRLKNVLDLERLITKVIYGSAGGRDLKAIQNTLEACAEIKSLLSSVQSEELKSIYETLDELIDIRTLIQTTIVDEPPFSIREGGMIKPSFNADVAKYSDILKNSSEYIKDLERREGERTNIKKLRIKNNRVFGYYIEVLNSNTEPIPPEYERKQTLANCERYVTPELKELEVTILSASDKRSALEYEIFQQIREKVAAAATRIRDTADKIARVDVYLSLAEVAVKNNYVCPEVDCSDVIEIKDGRHPVVENFVSDSFFVPNDTELDTKNNRLMLITGPNMAGKSTYMRQVALAVILAQIGSFVPAREARIGIVDKLFTRIGASDDLASGQSTFMLEMNEVAYILRNATKQSLIIFDEIGRGTSTFDGMSIAKAVAEYSVGKKLGAKTLFATHYHELTTLEEECEGVKNYNIAAKKKGDTLIFLRKIVRGAADDSYGIEVALLAGVPDQVIKRAKEVLKQIESDPDQNRPAKAERKTAESDIPLDISFESTVNDEMIEKIKQADLNVMTPIEALGFLYDIKKNLD